LLVERLEQRCLLSSYTFTKIADTGDGLANFGDAPALNQGGTIAFLAHPADGRVRNCIYTGGGADLTTIACEGPLDISLSTFPSIADDGTVAFVQSFRQTSQQILLGDGSTVTSLYATQGSFFTSFGDPYLNQSATVAFWASTLILSNLEGIFRGDGGDPAIIARDDVFDAYRFGRFPALNDAGTVAYQLRFFGPVFVTSVNVGDGDTTTVLYSNQDGFFVSFGNPVLNDAGVAAFFATLADGSSGIFSGDGGPLTIDAQTGEQFQSFAENPALNNHGQVAFLATLTGGGAGIFTADGTQIQSVIATGDDLQGSTVTELHFFRQGLNDASQVAFMATLADGTSGIYRADPPSARASQRHRDEVFASLAAQPLVSPSAVPPAEPARAAPPRAPEPAPLEPQRTAPEPPSAGHAPALRRLHSADLRQPPPFTLLDLA
jgi:hypothetical protein